MLERTELVALAKRMHDAGYHVLTFDDPAGTDALPGQFAMVRGAEWGDAPLLPRPMSYLSGGRTPSILIKVFGEGTVRMARAEPGEPFTVLGPLGMLLSVPLTTPGLLADRGSLNLPAAIRESWRRTLDDQAAITRYLFLIGAAVDIVVRAERSFLATRFGIPEPRDQLLALAAGGYVNLMRSIPLILVIFWFFFLVPLIMQGITGAERPPRIGAERTGARHSGPTSTTSIAAAPSSSDADRSTVAVMPQSWSPSGSSSAG